MAIDKDAVLALLNKLVEDVSALADVGSPDVSALQQQIADLQAQLSDSQKKTDDAVAALSAEVSKETDLSSQVSKLQDNAAKALDALKGAEAALTPEAPQA